MKNNVDFIRNILDDYFGEKIATELIEKSLLIQYLMKKTKSVNKSSKARGSYANLYAIYVLVEDYINNEFSTEGNYRDYEGMTFTDAFERQRKLPFGEKLQNHALNSRCNDEFKKFYSKKTAEIPIIRDLDTKRYWINENFLRVNVLNKTINISDAIIKIIDTYVKLKIEDFQYFFNELNFLKDTFSDIESIKLFILKSLSVKEDARIFEIVSFVILKYYYINHKVIFGYEEEELQKYNLELFKTGRTNANDGGIDFIMIPTGRIFQVTEELNFKKYFLDIEKINKFPITFVVKKDISPEKALKKIKLDAESEFDDYIIDKYLNCFEEIITIPVLKLYLETILENRKLAKNMIDELIFQCRIEYNLSSLEE